MGRMIVAIVLMCVAITAFQMAVILLLLVGLIFRTKETLGMLTVLAGFAAFQAHPYVGIAVGLMVVATACIAWLKRGDEAAELPADTEALTDMTKGQSDTS